jgi:ribonuclease E
VTTGEQQNPATERPIDTIAPQFVDTTTLLPREEAHTVAVAEVAATESSTPQEIAPAATPVAFTTEVEPAVVAETLSVAIAPHAEEHSADIVISLPPVITETFVATEPAEVPKPAAVSAPPPPAPVIVDVSASLQQAGLVMIETSSTPAKVAIALPTPTTLGRKPKAVATIASEPLQMVETQRVETGGN